MRSANFPFVSLLEALHVKWWSSKAVLIMQRQVKIWLLMLQNVSWCVRACAHTIDPDSEAPDLSFDSQYVPRDERFSAAKKDMFVGAGFRSFSRHLISAVDCLIREDRPFDSFEQIHRLFVKTYFPADSPAAPQLIREGSTKGTTLEFPSPGIFGGMSYNH